VRHEHVVEIYDIGLSAGWQHYILLEHLGDQTLTRLLEKELDPALAMRIVFEAAIPMSKIDPATVPSDAGGRLH